MKTVLIIGASGYLGSEYVRFLSNKNYNIIGTYFKNKNKCYKNKNVKYVYLNTLNISTFKNISKTKIDYVINFSGYVNHSKYADGGNKVIEYQFNGLLNIVNHFLNKSINKFINIGSSDEYGTTKKICLETTREKPFSSYSFAKTASTHFLQMINKSYNFKVDILRLFLVYGPRQESNRLLPAIIKGCLNDEVIKTSPGMQLRDFLYIDDAMNGIYKIMKKNKNNGEIYNLCSGKGIKIKDFILKVQKNIKKGKIKFGAISYRSGESLKLIGNNKKIKNHTKWKPTISLEMGIKKTIKYFIDENKN